MLCGGLVGTEYGEQHVTRGRPQLCRVAVRIQLDGLRLRHRRQAEAGIRVALLLQQHGDAGRGSLPHLDTLDTPVESTCQRGLGSRGT